MIGTSKRVPVMLGNPSIPFLRKIQVVHLLLQGGSEKEVPNSEGWTALMLASQDIKLPEYGYIMSQNLETLKGYIIRD